MAAGDLYALALEYLAACDAALATTPAGPPDRVYVAPSPPAWDCAQCVVYAGGPSVGDTTPLQPPLQPGHRLHQTGMVPLVQLTAQVVRCVPPLRTEAGGVVIPDVADIDAAAQETMADVWAIWNWLAARYRDETLFPPTGGSKREFWLDPAVSVGTMGGLAGWSIPIRIELSGYDA